MALFLLLLVGCSQLAYSEADFLDREVQMQAAVSPIVSPTPTLPSPTATPQPPPATLAPPATSTPSPTPVATATLPPPTFDNPINPELVALAEAHGADFVPLTLANTGLWQFAPHQFSHPIDLLWVDGMVYVLDRGRLWAIDLAQPTPPHLLLQPGDLIPAHESLMTPALPVQEPLAIAHDNGRLWLLDRVGDVYGYTPAMGWWLDRYDRPIQVSSSHYFVALATGENGRFLLDASYNYAFSYKPDQGMQGWNLPPGIGVDLAVRGAQVYVLSRNRENDEARLRLYQAGARLDRFSPFVLLERPRQVLATEVATETAVYLLDQAGARLLALHPDTGALLRVYQPPPGVTAVAATTDGRLLLAAPDRLYFYNQPDRIAHVAESGDNRETAVSFAPDSWLAERPLHLPVAGHGINQRELQMPGAPRHYRQGIHEGLDFYWAIGTPVMAVADGVVVRAMTDYVPPLPADFFYWHNETAVLGQTSAEALDFYRGQQVWVLHDDGLVARYAHLSWIAHEVAVGTQVAAGQVIGGIGNSGSPASIDSDTEDAHLHFELWRDTLYLGQYLRPIEARELLQTLFGQ